MDIKFGDNKYTKRIRDETLKIIVSLPGLKLHRPKFWKKWGIESQVSDDINKNRKNNIQIS